LYLKQLDLYGFKSFMDKLSVSFDYAITAIVGPNGSGKSNITDAIRWVLGEQSVKSLRGSRMEDVIFAGTAKHKPVSFAEVSLVLDNTAGLFSSPYTEITVTRRVYRSGDSEYFINKAPCRLKDIHELFMDTGLGRDGYSIISQGQIDSILSQKSEDRRQIFEEAAGISKYKYKKNEAMRKLATTEDNLARVRDIQGELASRLGPLETQSRKAREYLDLYEKLKTLEINLSILNITSLQEAKKSTGVLYENLMRELEAATARLEALKTEEASLYSEIRDRDAEIDTVRSRLHSADLSVKGWEGENALLLQRMETEQEAAKGYSADIAAMEAEILQFEEDARNAELSIEACRTAVTDAEKAVDVGRAKLEEIAGSIRTQTELCESLAMAATQLLTQADETAKHIASLSDSDLHTRIETLTEEITQAEKGLADSLAETERLTEECEAAKAAAEEAAAAFRKLAEERPRVQSSLQEQKNIYNETMRSYNQKLSRKNALSDMEQNMEGYGRGVRAVMGARLSGDIRGVLSQLIHVAPDLVTAIETALGGALQNIVVGSEEDAKAAIEYLKRTREGRATFLPISAIRGKRLENDSRVATSPGYLGLACDLVETDAEYRDIILHLLGTTVVMDTMDNAIRAARKFSYQFKIVTKEGEVLMRGGSMSGGSRGNTSSLLGRGEEIAALTKECATLSAKMQKIEDDIDEKNDRIADITEEMEALRNRHAKEKAALMQGEGAIRLCHTKCENEEQHIKRLRMELESAHAQIENADRERERLADMELDLRTRHSDANSHTEEARVLLYRYMEEQSRRRDTLTELQVAVNSAEKDLTAANTGREQILLSIQKKRGDILEKEQQRTLALRNAEDLRLRHQNRQIDIEEAKKQALTMQENLDKMLTEKDSAAARTAKMRVDVQTQTETVFALQGEKDRLETKAEKVQNELDDTITHLWDAYELTFSAAEIYRKDIGPLGPAKAEAAQLRRQIRALGSVNVDAVAEYAEVRQRHDFLLTQIADLEKAMAELQKIITDMTRVMTETFSKRFAEIAEHFKDTFHALFGGGTGKLSLQDPDNILESGIEIDVQPPGKKLQSLSLLSGGEKALTAIAILFSVLRVRPAPFCILDEIESALDDHNIDRFAAYLRNYADTQFIIVTHRRGTMEAADVLYGVTMQEKGVSKLLTMQLDDIRKES